MSYKAVISTGHNGLLEETHCKEGHIDVLLLIVVLHVLIHVGVYFVADQGQAKASLVLDIVAIYSSAHVSECLS